MNYVVLSHALRDLKSLNLRTNNFYNFVRYKPFWSQQLIVPRFYLEVLFINQSTIINIEVSYLFNVNSTWFVVDAFKDIVNVVVNSSHSVDPFFYSRGGEFVDIIKAYGSQIKAVETLA